LDFKEVLQYSFDTCKAQGLQTWFAEMKKLPAILAWWALFLWVSAIFGNVL